MSVDDPSKEKRIALLIRAYALILSWPDPDEDSSPAPTPPAEVANTGEKSEEAKEGDE